MTAQTVLLLLFLGLLKESSYGIRFDLEGLLLYAVEGSCAELKCSGTGYVQTVGAHWFWMKDAEYNKTRFEGTVIYSSNTTERSVSQGYEGRVEYTGSLSTSWRNGQEKPTCSVKLCNLNKSDSGIYAFRYLRGKEKWMTNPNITLNVIDNPCPITFEKPAAVNDFNTITLKCSTLSSCSSDLQIKGTTQQSLSQSSQDDKKQKSISSSFTVTWQDDGKEVSCQTSSNRDLSLIRKTSLTVHYAPRGVSAVMNPQGSTIKEGKSVTLKCDANGNPTPTFTWFVNDTKTYEGAELKFASINASQSGRYRCEAKNKLSSSKSRWISIDVDYPPKVEVTSSAREVTKGERMTLTCTVIRSKPEAKNYFWFRDDKPIYGARSRTFVVESVTPEDKGFYTCKASNSAGTGESAQQRIEVRYRPRRTKISTSENNPKVKVGDHLTFRCTTDAYPTPSHFSWYIYNTDRNKQIDSSSRESGDSLYLENVQRTDEACYVCNATNNIGTGDRSDPVCIQVLYPPTAPLLSMEDLVNEGQPTTISCTVESAPPSQLTLKRKSGSNPPEVVYSHSDAQWEPNKLIYRFNATSADVGLYTCEATNSIGSRKSVESKKLVVKYRPKDVIAKYQPKDVNENTQLKLLCSALSYPPVKSFSWTKTKDGKTESVGDTQNVTVKSASPSDSGLYSCTARNEMGSGKSQQVEIQVRYAPKLTKIIRGAEQKLPNGRSAVTLSCTSDGYPKVKEFFWFKKTQETHEEVSKSQTLTVYSDQPGDYHCIAKNEINQKSSEPVQMFVDRSFVKILIIFFLLMMLVVLLFLIVYRHRRKKSIQRRNSNTPSSFGSLSWWNSIGRRNEPTMAEPFRSRDDLLTDQPPHPNGQYRRQPRPDNTPASSSVAVYYTVNLPAGQQGPSGEMPVKQKARHTQDDSLNYASINFKNKEKQKNKRAEENAVYAVVSKNKTPKKENQEDYENLKTAQMAKPPNPPSYDSDTSEDEVEINYSQVNFKPKPGHQRANSDSSSTSSTSSTSSEEGTQYSQVKI
ncbi:B-cell receptor CD22 [Halichoeres trimaculatus]|uniref:B-cell receptor CD22 n=1 Tax=Halichoeres trimaculatus TaxID=147232 RepID=UPI003D9FB0DC